MKIQHTTDPQLYSQVIKLVIRNILANKRRNILTCLGIIIGIATFLCMSAIGNISTEMSNALVKSYGFNNMLFVLDDNTMRARGWSDNDIEYFESIPDVKCAVTYVDYSNDVSVTANGKRVDKGFLTGRSGKYYENVSETGIINGRAISDVDDKARSRVCVIDEEMADELFGSNDCLGEEVTVLGVNYSVIGVDRHKNNSPDRAFSLFSTRKHITIPASTFSEQLGLSLNSVFIFTETDDTGRLAVLHTKAVSYINDTLHLQPYEGFEDLYFADQLEDQIEQEKQQEKVKKIVSLICLLVGGIGIMNMMLVSVAERTREIGLRKALGATEKKIQMQFLMESVILSMAGGTVGVLLGLIFTFFADIFATIMLSTTLHRTTIATYVDWGGLVFSFLASVFVGVVFGVIPARKASKLSPIVALKL